MSDEEPTHLKRGWTTGACATAAAKAALTALVTGQFPDPVEISLPRGGTVAFPLAMEGLEDAAASAGIIKDAGDDPDVTHGALICVRVKLLPDSPGVSFKAGSGVGMVTKSGLPIPAGEPAINPVPRQMMTHEIAEVLAAAGCNPVTGVEVEISVPDGEELALKTWNPRLGIIGGISILGTTGIVRPFSCAAWIASIHRGIDVARANGLTHVVGATGATSERTAHAELSLPEIAYLDMGDFAGGMLKYLRDHPIERVTIAGGFAKLVKLAQGHLDLHSGRSQVSFNHLADWSRELGGDSALHEAIRHANTAMEVLQASLSAGLDLPQCVADRARATALGVVGDSYPGDIDIMVVDRAGTLLAKSQLLASSQLPARST